MTLRGGYWPISSLKAEHPTNSQNLVQLEEKVDQIKRTLADMENLRQRSARQAESTQKYAIQVMQTNTCFSLRFSLMAQLYKAKGPDTLVHRDSACTNVSVIPRCAASRSWEVCSTSCMIRALVKLWKITNLSPPCMGLGAASNRVSILCRNS